MVLRWYQSPWFFRREDRRALLDRVTEPAARAAELDPQNAHAWDSLGYVHACLGRYEASHGGQGEVWLTRALDEIGKALAIRPDDPQLAARLGMVHHWLGSVRDQAGEDPISEYRAALRSYGRAMEVDPGYVDACSGQVAVHASIAEYDDAIGVDPRPAVDDAWRIGERCPPIDQNLARAQLTLARYLVEVGDDPTAVLTSANGYLDRLEGSQLASVLVRYYRLVAADLEAAFRLHQGVDPARSIARGRAALASALQLAPGMAEVQVEAARLDLHEAAWLRRAHPESGELALLTKALASAEKAVALDGQLVDALLVAAEICQRIATARFSSAVIERGIDHVSRALVRNPRLVKAQHVRAELVRLRPRR